jgi:hypothetical protein
MHRTSRNSGGQCLAADWLSIAFVVSFVSRQVHTRWKVRPSFVVRVLTVAATGIRVNVMRRRD